MRITEDSLLHQRFAWWPEARLEGANFSPGVNAVMIGWPRLVKREMGDRDRSGAAESLER
jgi:hypothetical protein